MAIDQAKLDALLHQFVLDLGATVHAANVVIGDKLGLYKTLAELGPSTPGELAAQTGIAERYSPSGWRGRPPADISATTRRTVATTSPTSRRSRWPTRAAPRSCPAPSSWPPPASATSPW